MLVQCHAAFPRLQHDLDRPARVQLEPHRPRALAGAVPLQVREDRVQTFAADRHARQRQAHRRLELHEPAEPARRQVDLLLAVVGRAFGPHLEARGIDREPRLAVAAQRWNSSYSGQE